MDLTRFPRVRLSHAPTPMEPLDNLSKLLGGPRLWIKRDDCTGLALGGNKTRKLEFLLGAALAEGADTLITQGAVQSNHVRQTAAAAARCGLACEIVLEERVAHADAEYREGGNVLLDRLLGAHLRTVPAGTDMDAAMEAVADELSGKGRRPYVIPGGGSNPVGALGYAAVAFEIEAQANERDLRLDAIVHATGSSGTQAGLVAGLVGHGNATPVLGICVSRQADVQEKQVRRLAAATAEHLGIPGAFPADRVAASSDYVGQGYGVPTEGMIEAVGLLARHEGVLLDPVYSGKAMAGLIDLVRKGHWKAGRNVLFIHTGGTPGLFAYRTALAGA